MLRSLAIPQLLLLLLLMSLTIDARSIKQKVAPTEEPEVEESTYIHMQEGTVTVTVDKDLILTTNPEGEAFTEASPLELTEEPLPDSVIYQLEKERAQENRARNTYTDPENVETTTDNSLSTKKATKNSHRFGAPTTMQLGLYGFTAMNPEFGTAKNTEDTTEIEEITTVKNYFRTRPAALQMDGDMEVAENRMETSTHALAFQDENQDFLSMILTTDSNLVDEPVTYRGESDRAESMPTRSPFFRFFTASSPRPEVTEPQPETTTMFPETKKKEETTTMPVLMDSTETESITEEAQTTVAPADSRTAATEPQPLTTRMNLYLNAAVESRSTASVPETTTSTTSAPETTTVPETTILNTSTPETTTSTTSSPETIFLSTSAPETTTSTTTDPETTTSTTSDPETTTSTTSAPETTTSTTSAPETTTSTTSAPETTISTTSAPETTTSTTNAPKTLSASLTTILWTKIPDTTTPTYRAPETTIPTTRAPETTTTTTTSRPILTRAPRVERIFNSDGVEVLYGYSSVVRTNSS